MIERCTKNKHSSKAWCIDTFILKYYWHCKRYYCGYFIKKLLNMS